MKNKLPTPVCIAFLVFRERATETRTKEDIFIGLPRLMAARSYPVAFPFHFLIRCTSGHGEYRVEMQLQTTDGEILWKDGPPEPLPMLDPLETYDLIMKLLPVFPAPGVYQFVLVLNGEEISRQRFGAVQTDASPPMQENQ